MKPRLYLILTMLLLGMALLSFGNSAYALTPAQITVEGQGNYFNTGESYPTSIEIAGYNSRDQKIFLNFALETTKTVTASETATFQYVIDIYDDTGSKIGNLGTMDVPEDAIAQLGATTVSVSNSEITLSSALTAEYRVVVTVKGVSVA